MPDQGQAAEASPHATARAAWAHLSAEDIQALTREVREEVLAELVCPRIVSGVENEKRKIPGDASKRAVTCREG